MKLVGVSLLIFGVYDTKVYWYALTKGEGTFDFFGRELPARHRIVKIGFSFSPRILLCSGNRLVDLWLALATVRLFLYVIPDGASDAIGLHSNLCGMSQCLCVARAVPANRKHAPKTVKTEKFSPSSNIPPIKLTKGTK